MEEHVLSQVRTGDDAVGTEVDENPEEVKTGGAQSALDQARNTYRSACDGVIKVHNLILKIPWPGTSRIPEWKSVAHA